MLYLEDDRRELWPTVARALASLELLDMVLWLESHADPTAFPAPFTAPEREEYLESVTDSDGHAPTLHSARVHVDEDLLAMLDEHSADLEDWGEALSLYRPRAYELVAAWIPHEGVIVVADEFESALAASGLLVSPDLPDWW